MLQERRICKGKFKRRHEDRLHTAKGDKAVNIEASQYARGNISVYVGKTKINGEDSAFIQVRDNKTGKVGQFPHPSNGNVTWGTFDPDSPICTNYSTEDVNRAAKFAYNEVAEYIADLETMGLDYKGCFENGGFPNAHTQDGLKIDCNSSLTEGDKAINDWLKFYYDGMIVYVGTNGTDAYGYPEFFVQAKDPKTGKTGQYPHPTQGEATWGTFDENTSEAVKSRELDEDAKTAYNAVAEYIADYETEHGLNSLQEIFDNGEFPQANTKDGLKIGTKELTKGDAAVNSELLNNGRGTNVSVYVGMATINSEESFFVQVKDNTTGNIGQYPTPDHRNIEWGTLHAKKPNQSEKITLSLYADRGSSAKVNSIKLEAGSTIPESTIASWIEMGESMTTDWIPYNGYSVRTVFIAIQNDDGERIEKYIDNPVISDSNFYIITTREKRVESLTRDSATWGTN
ncbi:hypothetical protein [Ruminococcus albus]|uniref:Uncharacterized protein n=1 Tax=Ruminococcus albus TaxID=1264 RepID=A0A1I1IGK1_RUMAL|nr:hypothetical protein [Ruminococcus albus]SFC35417.1 hypothetical protein SAMN02910406_01583 [Ruminococcus albus]